MGCPQEPRCPRAQGLPLRCWAPGSGAGCGALARPGPPCPARLREAGAELCSLRRSRPARWLRPCSGCPLPAAPGQLRSRAAAPCGHRLPPEQGSAPSSARGGRAPSALPASPLPPRAFLLQARSHPGPGPGPCAARCCSATHPGTGTTSDHLLSSYAPGPILLGTAPSQPAATPGDTSSPRALLRSALRAAPPCLPRTAAAPALPQPRSPRGLLPPLRDNVAPGTSRPDRGPLPLARRPHPPHHHHHHQHHQHQHPHPGPGPALPERALPSRPGGARGMPGEGRPRPLRRRGKGSAGGRGRAIPAGPGSPGAGVAAGLRRPPPSQRPGPTPSGAEPSRPGRPLPRACPRRGACAPAGREPGHGDPPACKLDPMQTNRPAAGPAPRAGRGTGTGTGRAAARGAAWLSAGEHNGRGCAGLRSRAGGGAWAAQMGETLPCETAPWSVPGAGSLRCRPAPAPGPGRAGRGLPQPGGGGDPGSEPRRPPELSPAGSERRWGHGPRARAFTTALPSPGPGGVSAVPLCRSVPGLPRRCRAPVQRAAKEPPPAFRARCAPRGREPPWVLPNQSLGLRTEPSLAEVWQRHRQ
ncbi:basic proline-rich protein-like [Neopsephotus bourkii]|uniref:basic proline-rich protein-like n=1 Tax=Neopsephotus bourkii TaxID=309878 RepID=UPI002AA5518E|nr:basic proline-rich protein-like [Neopsephotus bourkii]